uniref:Putative secreted protein n=1 Tax=Ixodes ricinus TaxID=34613 RepID=A0A6B0U553_IXORI
MGLATAAGFFLAFGWGTVSLRPKQASKEAMEPSSPPSLCPAFLSSFFICFLSTTFFSGLFWGEDSTLELCGASSLA